MTIPNLSGGGITSSPSPSPSPSPDATPSPSPSPDAGPAAASPVRRCCLPLERLLCHAGRPPFSPCHELKMVFSASSPSPLPLPSLLQPSASAAAPPAACATSFAAEAGQISGLSLLHTALSQVRGAQAWGGGGGGGVLGVCVCSRIPLASLPTLPTYLPTTLLLPPAAAPCRAPSLP